MKDLVGSICIACGNEKKGFLFVKEDGHIIFGEEIDSFAYSVAQCAEGSDIFAEFDIIPQEVHIGDTVVMPQHVDVSVRPSIIGAIDRAQSSLS